MTKTKETREQKGYCIICYLTATQAKVILFSVTLQLSIISQGLCKISSVF